MTASMANLTDDERWVRTGLASVQSLVDVDEVLRQWLAARLVCTLSGRSSPRPLWATRTFDDAGPEAWRSLSGQAEPVGRARALSIYVHVPFCEERCGFCDCYSLPWPAAALRRRDLDLEFGDRLCAEIAAWSELPHLAGRPVTTIHFGGGTANTLQPPTISRIVAACRDRLGMHADTEWAVESTSRQLTPAHRAFLKDLGFGRLHLGVQTLDDSLRVWLGRRNPARIVLDRLAAALGDGLIVSADVLYGLPGQTAQSLLATLAQLADVGVHGVSLYRLNITSRNQAWFRKSGGLQGNEPEAYLSFQAADQWLKRRGYEKNHFTHYARPEDRHLYYRHALRGEDLLALGPTADGQLGNYVYRHPNWGEYRQIPVPGLQGGLRETLSEQALRPIKVALMAGRFSRGLLRQLDAESLLPRWTAGGFVEVSSDSGSFHLTGSGSWFIQNLIQDVMDHCGAPGRAPLVQGPQS
jgi:oxygen-independent coproporphyrinogen-3 oxidase